MKRLPDYLRLKPHEDRLLTSSANFWLFSARTLVVTMAFAEAAAWGYLGYLFGDGSVRLLTAAFAGCATFVVVWTIDISLITLDRAWPEHAHKLLGAPLAVTKRKLRDLASLGLRVGLLTASLTITAPYLAQIVFYRDIDEQLASDATASIDEARTDQAETFDEALAAKRLEIEEKRNAYELEVAGRGNSGRFGHGPTAAAIARSVTKLEQELHALEQEKAASTAAFEKLAADWPANRDALAAKYNVLLPRETILGNYRALEQLRKRPENRQTERAIKVFLALIFAGMLLLKLFEPNSVRLYFSELLQQEYVRYRAGTFDDLLPPTERSTSIPGGMSPQRFYTFLCEEWNAYRLLNQRDIEEVARGAAAAKSLETLEQLRVSTQRDLDGYKSQVSDLSRALDDTVQSMAELRSAIGAVRKDIEYLTEELRAVDTKADQFDERGRLEYRALLTRQLADATRALRQLEESEPVETERHGRAKAAVTEVIAKVQAADSELAERERVVRKLRDEIARRAEERARTVLA